MSDGVFNDGVSDLEKIGESAGDETDALLSRLRLIEDQPLQDRAGSFAQIHDELRAILESGDAQQQHA